MFRIHALAAESFAPLFDLSDAELAQRHIRRVVADKPLGYPCRISLQDAQVGEELLLLSFEHLTADSPYRASGPIFVRRGATQRVPDVDEVPDYVRLRKISLRGYDAKHLMVAADVCPGSEIAAAIERAFADPQVEYLHLHNAKAGCYSCRVTRD